ncbi:uncharacterized protein LOC109364662 [Meleagris gallopavo]|uniref:uncharacterized protein LOC109364662 n=1 Tax=Meleagris gallopavo TaxID=9103 RepID=UPI000938BB44|nr:uncharacterized protein LOC109364662 [Meleagris gallopavo]
MGEQVKDFSKATPPLPPTPGLGPSSPAPSAARAARSPGAPAWPTAPPSPRSRTSTAPCAAPRPCGSWPRQSDPAAGSAPGRKRARTALRHGRRSPAAPGRSPMAERGHLWGERECPAGTGLALGLRRKPLAVTSAADLARRPSLRLRAGMEAVSPRSGGFSVSAVAVDIMGARESN